MTDDILQFVPIIFWTIIISIPLYFLVKRSGQSLWWMLLCLIPLAGCIILLWILAFAKWPILETKPGQALKP